MASNPMQRKSRISFLTGVIITLAISGVIIAILLLQLKKVKDEQKKEAEARVMVYTLTQDVKSGQVITEDMFKKKEVNRTTVPSNATATQSVIDSWYLQTKEGESVCTELLRTKEQKRVTTDSTGGDDCLLYLDRSGDGQVTDGIIEVMQNNGKAFEDQDGTVVEKGDAFTFIDGEIKKVKSNAGIITDQYGAFLIDKENKDTKIRVYREEATGEYYTYKIDRSAMNTGDNITRVKDFESISINNVPVVAKISMNANTVVTPNFVVRSDEAITDDMRKQEYNMVILPIDLMTNDYVDVRLMLPNGQDFIVVSKAQADVPTNSDGTYVPDTVRLNLREEEILSMSSAIVEAYGLIGSKLYATKYVEPGMQKESAPTYVPNAAVTAELGLIIEGNTIVGLRNQNVVEIAMNGLRQRYERTNVDARNNYLQSLIDGTEDFNDNIQERAEEDIANADAARKKYLETLGK